MPSQSIHFVSRKNAATTFAADGDGGVWLRLLCGFSCGLGGQDQGPPRARGLAVLDTSIGRFEADGLTWTQCESDETSVSLSWSDKDERIALSSRWTFFAQTGIWSRRDILRNTGRDDVTVFRALARFPFAPGRYEVYSQSSRWCHENQGVWQDLHHGGIVLGSEGGRTTQGGTPYMALREKASGAGVAFHILPRGNWVVKVTAYQVGGDSLPFAVVELGLSDQSLHLKLSPNASFELPEILIQPLPSGQPERGAPHLHRYLQHTVFGTAKKTAPIMYNTWFDAFDALEVARLKKQLVAAKQIGCEVFTVDAGWYGAGEGNWSVQTGDWREKPDAAFKGKMAEFADAVRAEGLGFGLWMEPERNFASVPAVQAHPDWFLPGANGCFYPDLANSHAYEYIFSEMSRLVATYKLAWMKVDFNFELGEDPCGSEFSHYYVNWYRLLDALRARFPEVFFEGCASGGMRLDLNSLQHVDGHFLSDNVNPVDVLRIYQAALLRLPPGRIAKWVVLRSVGRSIPQYGLPVGEAPVSLITPSGCGATWELSETTTVDFAARVALPGMPGLSGDLAGLPPEALERLAYHIGFYKKWREFLVGSTAHLLTPCRPKEDHTGWVAIQLCHPEKREHLLFVYRLDDACGERVFRLRDMDPDTLYAVTEEDAPEKRTEWVIGERLTEEGLAVSLPNRFSAAVWVLAPG
ncbi:MAG: glycoside hydrolase family 36 protein [Candidatus Latescibacterota bacterium]